MADGGTHPVSEDPKLAIAPQGEGGYDVCWYPVCMSKELQAGQVKSVSFLDGRVIVYRGESGRAFVSSAFCRHLGADLSIGEVEGDEVRCAFHRWKYGTDGACNHIPSGDTPPPEAQLFAFPTVEKWGLIWAFNGEMPLYDPPHFDIDDDKLVFATEYLLDLPQDHWVLLSNSCDFQHLEALHNLTVHTQPGDIVQPDTHHLEAPIAFSDPKFGRLEQFTRLFGTNCLTLTGTMEGRPMCTMWAGMPMPGNQTRGWMVTATLKPDTDTPEQKEQADDILKKGAAFFKSLTEDDNVIMQNLRFRQDLTTPADWALVIFLKYIRNYPRAHPSKPYIQ